MRPIVQLAEDLTAIRDHYRSTEPLDAQAVASVRWVAPLEIVLAVVTYSAVTAWWVFR